MLAPVGNDDVDIDLNSYALVSQLHQELDTIKEDALELTEVNPSDSNVDMQVSSIFALLSKIVLYILAQTIAAASGTAIYGGAIVTN